MAAFSGFEAYKTIQMVGGGSIEIQFPGKDGKTSPPPPMPDVHRVAVWPGDQGDVRFAERLQSSGRYSVVAPAAVSTILTDAKLPTDLRQLTNQEQDAAFETVCHRAKVDFVFAARPLGASSNTNMFSFSSANATFTADLLGYQCGQHAIVWRDKIALVVKSGQSPANESEMLQASGDAWADRVLQIPNAQNS